MLKEREQADERRERVRNNNRPFVAVLFVGVCEGDLASRAHDVLQILQALRSQSVASVSAPLVPLLSPSRVRSLSHSRNHSSTIPPHRQSLSSSATDEMNDPLDTIVARRSLRPLRTKFFFQPPTNNWLAVDDSDRHVGKRADTRANRAAIRSDRPVHDYQPRIRSSAECHTDKNSHTEARME
jgi:hypothetical protein